LRNGGRGATGKAKIPDGHNVVGSARQSRHLREAVSES
jgi:hypothetical protein